MDINDIRNRFYYHAPKTEERRRAHEDVRTVCLTLAVALNDLVPDGREKSLAVKAVEDAMMWANAGIARQPE